MGLVTNRTSFTSRARAAFIAWIDPRHTYSVLQLNLGNNSNSRLEIASALNLFNYAIHSWWYMYQYATEKYNPKVYLSAVQSVAYEWNIDKQDPQKVDPKWVTADGQKSGSWPQKF